MKHFRFCLAGFLCFLVFQVVPGSSSALSADDTSMTSFDREVFITLTNRVRQKESYCNYDLMPAVEPVVWCDTLAWAALKHCKALHGLHSNIARICTITTFSVTPVQTVLTPVNVCLSKDTGGVPVLKTFTKVVQKKSRSFIAGLAV